MFIEHAFLTSMFHVPSVSMLLASLVMLNGDPRGGFFYHTLTLMMGSFNSTNKHKTLTANNWCLLTTLE